MSSEPEPRTIGARLVRVRRGLSGHCGIELRQ